MQTTTEYELVVVGSAPQVAPRRLPTLRQLSGALSPSGSRCLNGRPRRQVVVRPVCIGH
jgi:hypothetical protein